MLGQRCRGGRERDGQAGVQHVAERHRQQLRRVDAAAVASPQQRCRERRQRRHHPAAQQHDRLGGDARDGRHRMLHLDFQRAALAIAGHQADRHEREQEDRGHLAGAEGRRPDPDERRERLADAGGRAVQPARFSIAPHRADEGDADQRPHREQQHPPGAGRHQLAVFLGDQPRKRWNRRDRRARGENPSLRSLRSRRFLLYVRARNTSSRSPGTAPREAACDASWSNVPSPRIVPPHQQDEAIADPRRILDLMDRQDHRAAGRRVGAQRRGDVAALAQVEAVERLVGQQHRLRHQQADREQRPLALPFRQAADSRIEQRPDVEAFYDLVAQPGTAVEKPQREVDRPSNRLRGPRGRWNQADRTAWRRASARSTAARRASAIRHRAAAPHRGTRTGSSCPSRWGRSGRALPPVARRTRRH